MSGGGEKNVKKKSPPCYEHDGDNKGGVHMDNIRALQNMYIIPYPLLKIKQGV